MSRTRKPSNAISYQCSVRGKGLAQLTREAMTELVERALDGVPPPAGVHVDIQCWRAGSEIDMSSTNPRAMVLRETFRRLLQTGRVRLAIRGSEEDDE
jgi:hypothetical protein